MDSFFHLLSTIERAVSWSCPVHMPMILPMACATQIDRGNAEALFPRLADGSRPADGRRAKR